MAHTIPLIMQWDENLDVGSDTGTPVADEDYQVPFAFNGTIGKVTLKLDRPVLTDADKAKLAAASEGGRRRTGDSLACRARRARSSFTGSQLQMDCTTTTRRQLTGRQRRDRGRASRR